MIPHERAMKFVSRVRQYSDFEDLKKEFEECYAEGFLQGIEDAPPAAKNVRAFIDSANPCPNPEMGIRIEFKTGEDTKQKGGG